MDQEARMFHFFPRFARDIHNSPLATELRRLNVPHRLFSEELNWNYSSRLTLLFFMYPHLIIYALRNAVRSLVFSRPKPTATVITSDVEAIIFGTTKILFSRKTSIVFETFILSDRKSVLAKKAHIFYYGLVLRFVDIVICHSESEARRYSSQFPHTKFIAVHYALSVNGREELRAAYEATAAQSNVVVTAGRSGRDYATLARAIEGLPLKLRVICDWNQATQALENLEQVTILKRCFKADMLTELAQARMVVIPLLQSQASAGQMVLLQAFALARPVIITDTITTREYVTDGYDALLVKSGDATNMRRKMVALLDSPMKCEQLGKAGSSQYDAHFSTEAYVRKLVSILENIPDCKRFQ